MPYECRGSVLYHKKDGVWKIKQKTDSAENCKAAMGLLYGLESGDIKQEDVGKGKFAQKLKG